MSYNLNYNQEFTLMNDAPLYKDGSLYQLTNEEESENFKKLKDLIDLQYSDFKFKTNIDTTNKKIDFIVNRYLYSDEIKNNQQLYLRAKQLFDELKIVESSIKNINFTKEKNIKRLNKLKTNLENEILELTSSIGEQQNLIHALLNDSSKNERKNEIFKELFNNKREKILDTAKNNIFYFSNEDECIEKIKENKDKNEQFFYIMAMDAHYYLTIQENKKIKIVDFCQRECSKLFLQNLSENKDFKVSINIEKIQYNSGCCEMYAIMLPFLTLKLQLLNNLTLDDIFINDKKSKFHIHPLIYNAFNELAFDGNNIGKKDDKDEDLFERRFEQIDKQIENLKDLKNNNLDLILDVNNNFSDFYQKELENLKPFLIKFKQELKDKKLILHSIIFKEAIKNFDEVDKNKPKLLDRFFEEKKEEINTKEEKPERQQVVDIKEKSGELTAESSSKINFSDKNETLISKKDSIIDCSDNFNKCPGSISGQKRFG